MAAIANTPLPSAAQNGSSGSLNATNASGQINQFLGTHGIKVVYDGIAELTPNGGTNFTWLTLGNATDLDQVFILSGTTIGRVTLPINPIGKGADLLVTLYPDNGGGSPNTSAPITSTMLSAGEISQLAAASGLVNGGPLANELNNTGLCTGGVITSPWAAPTIGSGGATLTASYVSDGDFFIGAGGNDPITNAAVAGVATVQYQGGGFVSLPIPQPSLPVALSQAAVAVCNGCVVSMGGGSGSSGSTPTNGVYVASWDNVAGIIGSWSVQANLPISIFASCGVGYGNNVYTVGGITGGSPLVTSAVYFGTVDNGQITSWTATTPLPVPLANTMLGALNGWMIAIGGLDSGLTNTTGFYYAKINDDGTLGDWASGPSLSPANSAFGPGFDMAIAGDLVCVIGGGSGGAHACSIIAVTENGVGPTWQNFTWPAGGFFPIAAFIQSQSAYDLVALRLDEGDFTNVTSLASVPMISVPLYATGLTNTGVYHVVMQQFQNDTSADYLQLGVNNAGQSNPTLPQDALVAARHGSSWSVYEIGWAVPMTVFDTSATGSMRHLWSEPNTQTVVQQRTSLINSQEGLLTGLVEVTLKPDNALNSNPTFTSGVSPWTATGGTITQSNAQTQGGFAFSGLLTPSGSSAMSFAASEFVGTSAGNGPFQGEAVWYLVDGWYYSPTGYATFSVNMNWYDNAQGYLSTTVRSSALTAATWTHVKAYHLAPATSAFGKIIVQEAGTPAVGNTVFLSNVMLVKSPECVRPFGSVVTVDYSTGGYPPTSATQLL